MPKVKNNDLVLADSETEDIEMGDNTYELTPNPDRPTQFVFGRALKYDYPDEVITQDEKQAFRRKMRRQAERLASGKPLNPYANRVKKSDTEKAQARKDRRNLRNDVKFQAFQLIADTVPEYKGMSAYDVYLSLRDTVKNG